MFFERRLAWDMAVSWNLSGRGECAVSAGAKCVSNRFIAPD